MPAVFQPTPDRIPRSEHSVSRAAISKHALHVLYGLHRAGYDACLVGGGVRDLLLGQQPKDFDIVTDARPEQVAQVFRNCRLIGRRFRLAHVHFGRDIVEVATYRAAPDGSEGADDALSDGERILRDNVYGTRAEDALRRDFTINALYYDIADFALLDYVGAMADIRSRTLRMIGDPARRYREDPVRLLRAVRLAAKLGLSIEPATREAMAPLAHLLGTVSKARLFDELVKLLMNGYALRSYALLREFGLVEHLFAVEARDLDDYDTLIRAALESTDRRVAEDMPVTPAFLVAVMLWAPLERAMAQCREEGAGEFLAVAQAARTVLAEQNERVQIPRRFTLPAHEMWTLQMRMARRRRVASLLGHPRLRAAYDFLLLRAQAQPDDAGLQDLARFWTDQVGSAPAPATAGRHAPEEEEPAGGRRRRRGGRRRRRGGGASMNAAIGA